MTASATLVPLTIQEAKVGVRVVLIGTHTDVAAPRGRIVTNKDGWVGVRFDDGVTRMARAKVLARDTIQTVEFKVPPPAKPAPKPLDVAGVPGADKPSKAEAIAARNRRIEAAAVRKVATPEALGKQLAADRALVDAIGKRTKVIDKAAKASKPRAPKVEAKPGAPCLCGCGELAKSGRSFLQGHDARFHGWMKRLADGRMKPSDPTIPRSALKLMTVVDGCPTTDYDGSPWKP